MSKKTKEFNQLCVLHGVIVGEAQVSDFETHFLNEMGVRVKYLTELQTNPDINENGVPVPETGGRNDVFFHVHDEDVMKFAIPRLQMGIRWWEDIIGNGNGHLYSQEFLDANPTKW